jgi:D-serine deaminase-like pyridoxal phosphate-dependent protein
MIDRASTHGVRLRPHLKTAKSVEVAREALHNQFGGITISTIAEARYFAERGFLDLTYAVGIVPEKLAPLATLKRDYGASITIILDHFLTAKAAAAQAAELGASFDVLIEIDTGGRRGGVAPEAPDVVELGALIHDSGPALRLGGVLTHAGHSYHARTVDEVRSIAEGERAGAVRAAQRLKSAGLPCSTVSVGSTPTMVHAASLEGVTEIRPGVYMFFDVDQALIGACGVQDIAVSVLASVIGHNHRAARIVIDAGALALSKDLSATKFRGDVGYGWVCPAHNSTPISGLRVADVHQEHGLIAGRGEGPPPWDQLPIASRVRVLPNHACLTVAPYDKYYVVEGGDEIVAVWEKASGW